MAPITKEHISSPLEAGSSLLDAKILPAVLTSALEYVSARLSRRNLHISLIVIRKEVQIPSTGMTPVTSTLPSPALSRSSSTSSTFSRALSKVSSRSSLSSSGSSIYSNSTASSTISLSRTQHPSLPTSPKDKSAVPRLNFTSVASAALPCSTPTAPNPYGISLLHAATLSPRAEKILRSTIQKAEKKFPSIGSGWLSPKPFTSTSSTSNLPTNDLIQRSIAQNEILFSSEGLTLLSLDHVYTFKSHLLTYSHALTPDSLTIAVDELRRLILAQKTQTITKNHLTRSYDWLGISFSALVDVNQAYKITYGGHSHTGAIDCQDTLTRTQLTPLSLKTSFSRASPQPTFHSVRMSYEDTTTHSSLTTDMYTRSSFCSSEVSYFSPSSSCGSGTPETAVPLTAISMGESARGFELDTAISYQFDLEAAFKEDRGPHFRGPMTPNAFEDITPVTKGEWGFLMTTEMARRGAVETC
ncbi:hypothetical protein HYFRA_00009175 [Hymenoscyphus fraxineus]|uniref:DUF7582 domain-containing protein n=1 Tax=Hymenoscyphus fraxineus TaxID=746836 RepID=A0A9N9KWU5_9HELO|nr:hypothetical protein HYFRA_00009175 [Hymenoscyphus fraxineus]